MNNLEKYFDLFDQSRTSDQAMEDLIRLFSDDIVFILNGYKQTGIANWIKFVHSVFKDNADIKHMFEGWKRVEGTDLFETRWAVCGKRSSGAVFTQTGKDVAKLDNHDKINYLENIPDDKNMFETYKN